MLSWLHPITHASITRCSQPLVGPHSKRSHEDESYAQIIYKANTAKSLHIMDARPKINAVANLVSYNIIGLGLPKCNQSICSFIIVGNYFAEP